MPEERRSFFGCLRGFFSDLFQPLVGCRQGKHMTYIGLLQAWGLYRRICALTVYCSVNYCDYELQLIHCMGKKLNAITGDRSVLQNIPILLHKLYKFKASSNSHCRMWMISLTLTDYRKRFANYTVYSNWNFATSCSARMRVIVNYHYGCHNFKTTALFEQPHHGVPRIRVKVFINCRIKFLVLKEGLTGRIRWTWIISIVWTGRIYLHPDGTEK